MTHQILILGDCFKIFDSIPDKSIDLILTDPPYSLRFKESQIELHGRKAFFWNWDELKKWDTVDIKELYEKLMPHFDRILKDTGSILMFVRNEWITYLVDAGKKYNFDVKQSIFWKKTNPCLTPNSIIFTDNGPRKISDITNDLVWSANGNFQLAKKTMRQYKGNIINLSIAGSQKINVTPEHQILAVKQEKCSLPCFSNRICEFRFKNTYPICPRSDTNKKRKCERKCDNYQLKYIEAKKLEKGDLIVFPRLYPVSQNKSIKVSFFMRGHHKQKSIKEIPINKDTMRLIGYYLAEGHYNNTVRGDNRGGFTFSKKEKNLSVEVVNIIKKYFNYICKTQVDGNRIRISFCHAPLIEFLKFCGGHSALNKKINHIIINQPQSLLFELINAYFMGDGCFLIKNTKNDIIFVSSISKNLIYQISMILYRLGYPHKISVTNANKLRQSQGNRKIRSIHDIFRLSIGKNKLFKNFLKKRIMSYFFESRNTLVDKKYVYVPITKITRRKYNGSVFDLTTRTGNFVSNIGIVHNCPQVRKKNYLSAVETIAWLARWKEKSVPYTFNFKKNQMEMQNWIEMPLCGGKERVHSGGYHPTQKPEKLIEHFIEVHSNKDDWILDPFVGSGTVSKVSRDMGRNSIGVEIEPKYFKWAKERLAGQQQITGNVDYVFIDLNLDSEKEKKINIIKSLLEENKLRTVIRAPKKKRPRTHKQVDLNG